jgi:hypothetical protein
MCVVHGKAALKQASARPGTNKHFFGLVFTASRLLPPTKSVTQAKRQDVLFGRCLLAGAASHWNIIAYWMASGGAHLSDAMYAGASG